MDPCETSESDKLCSGEFSDEGLTAREEIAGTCEDTLADYHANKSAQSCQKQGHKYLAQDVFLSHSGAQKNFVRHLYRYLKGEGVSCFFDEDPESLRKGEKFPPCIFEATETCRVAVLVLSKEFIRSKWPMLELTALVKAKKSGKNPNLKILPIFFKISPKDFCQMTQDIQDWKELEESEQKRGEWLHASNEIRSFNGFLFSEGENEVSFIDKVVRAIKFELPSSRAYFVSFMQGQTRMCQEVANLFKNASWEVNGIHIAGLYGLAGSGKTTVSMAFCNFNRCDFEGKVCHVEFQRGKSVETTKLVLQHLTHSTETLVNSLTTKHVAWEMFSKQACGQRVLLALDNITEDPEIIEEVRVYLSAEFASGSHILLSARSLKILVKFLPARSCMHVPNLTEEEAIGILLERTSVREWVLRAEDRAFALNCAKRCWFKETPADNDMVEGTREFHPLALKSFGGYLFTKHESDFSRWISELSDFPKAGGRDLQDVLAVLEKAYLDMDFKYQTIFILLSVYMQPKMSSDKVFKWLAIICNTKINYIDKAVEDLMQKAFIERVEPEVRIHDLLVEFAQNKVNKMEKWLWVNGNMESLCQLISEDDAGFELIKFEDCTYRTPSMVRRKFLENLLLLQLVDMKNLSKLDLSSMDNVRSIIIHNCKELQEIEGMEKLSNLAWLQICQVKPTVKLPIFSSLYELQHLEIDIPNCAVTGREGKSIKQERNHSRIHLGDLTCCVFLKEICVRSPFLMEFPTVKGLPYLEKLEFIDCFDVMGPLDCTGCSELRKIVFNFCCQMAHLPLISGCSKLSEIVIWQCDALTECPQIEGQTCLETLELCISSEAGEGNPPIHLDSCFGLKNIQLWNMRKFMKLPEFSGLSKLTTLRLHCCGICDPPEFGGCPLLENVSFFSLKKLKRFPSFSELRALRKLCLWNCKRVRAPPDISGCSQLQVFHLVYNDNMQGLPQMDDFHTLEEIKISWHAQTQDEFIHMESDSDSEADEFDDLEFCLNHWKDTRIKLCEMKVPVILKEFLRRQSKTMLLKMYSRGGNLFYSITAPYDGTHNIKKENNIGDTLRSRVLVLKQFFTAEIRWIRRVHEMRWGRKWGYYVKLSDAGLHEPVWQLFKGLNLEDHPQMEGKELWLQMWKEWELKWEEESKGIWEANTRVGMMKWPCKERNWRRKRWMEWHIKSYWEENWRNFSEACGVKQTMEMVRERCIEWNIENYWEGKDYLIYEKHMACKGRLAENGKEGLREKLRDEGGSKLIEWNIRNYWEEKWKEMSEAYGGNEWEDMAMERFIECDIQNYWKKKWKFYQGKEWREMLRERLIWEMNSMKKIDALLKRQQRILETKSFKMTRLSSRGSFSFKC